MSDLSNAVIAAQALYRASGGKITQNGLVTMVAVAGQQSAWQSVVQAGGNIGDPLVGVGIWQITPGTEADLDPFVCAQATWILMQREPNNPYEPWNLQADGRTLIWQFGKEPDGTMVQIHPPTDYQYEIAEQAAAVVWAEQQQGEPQMFIEADKTENVEGIAIKVGDLFEKTVFNGASSLHGVPTNLVSTIPASWIVKDVNGGWINRYAGHIVAAV
jgi:hypothetical protein